MPYRAMPYGATPCHTILAYKESPSHGKSVCTYLWILNRLLQWSEFSQNLFFLCKSSAARSRVLNEAIWIFSHACMSTIPYFSAYIAVCCLYICGVAIVTKSCTYFREYWIFCHLRQRSRISWERQYTGKILNLPLSCTFTAAVQKWILRRWWWWWWWWWRWWWWRWWWWWWLRLWFWWWWWSHRKPS